jgi:hypothetical protein
VSSFGGAFSEQWPNTCTKLVSSSCEHRKSNLDQRQGTSKQPEDDVAFLKLNDNEWGIASFCHLTRRNGEQSRAPLRWMNCESHCWCVVHHQCVYPVAAWCLRLASITHRKPKREHRESFRGSKSIMSIEAEAFRRRSRDRLYPQRWGRILWARFRCYELQKGCVKISVTGQRGVSSR